MNALQDHHDDLTVSGGTWELIEPNEAKIVKYGEPDSKCMGRLRY